MAGPLSGAPTPQAITVHGQSKLLEVSFSDGVMFRIPFELMRVYSPSAEVQGHGPGQEVLQTGKREVDLQALEPVGNYAVQPAFADGHNTGIFSWDYLFSWAGSRKRCGHNTPAVCRPSALTATPLCPWRAATPAPAIDAGAAGRACVGRPW